MSHHVSVWSLIPQHTNGRLSPTETDHVVQEAEYRDDDEVNKTKVEVKKGLKNHCVSKNFPGQRDAGASCEIVIAPSWTGFLFVEFFYAPLDIFVVDDYLAFSDWHQLAEFHGAVPTNLILWMAHSGTVSSYHGWRLCHVDSMPPFSIREMDECYIDREGCVNLARRSEWDPFYETSVTPCRVSINDTWTGVVDVWPVDVSSENYNPWLSQMTVAVNGEAYHHSPSGDFMVGLQGLAVRGVMEISWTYRIPDVKLCPVPLNVSGPWGEQPWTCTILGDPCTGACTQQFSDRNDADGDRDLHDGHPLCQSSVGESFCGPCRCGAGEAQSYVSTRLFSHTQTLPLISCSPCPVGRFKNDHNTDQDDCEVCRPGHTSVEGATACATCDAGWFNNEDVSDCAPCTPGHYGDGAGQTACQACAMGSVALNEAATACTTCDAGWFNNEDVSECAPCTQSHYGDGAGQTACQACAMGSVALNEAATACTVCDPGWFTNEVLLECAPCTTGHYGDDAGQTACQECEGGSYSEKEGQTVCLACLAGTVLLSRYTGCRECPAGSYATHSMNVCLPCETGRFQNASGKPLLAPAARELFTFAGLPFVSHCFEDFFSKLFCQPSARHATERSRV